MTEFNRPSIGILYDQFTKATNIDVENVNVKRFNRVMYFTGIYPKHNVGPISELVDNYGDMFKLQPSEYHRSVTRSFILSYAALLERYMSIRDEHFTTNFICWLFENGYEDYIIEEFVSHLIGKLYENFFILNQNVHIDSMVGTVYQRMLVGRDVLTEYLTGELLDKYNDPDVENYQVGSNQVIELLRLLENEINSDNFDVVATDDLDPRSKVDWFFSGIYELRNRFKDDVEVLIEVKDVSGIEG